VNDHGEHADAIPLAEASAITGLTPDALRLRLRRGTVAGFKADGRLFLYRASLPVIDRSSARSSERSADDRDRAEIELLRRQLEIKDQQIHELHMLLGRAQERALPAPEAASPERRLWWRWWR
jgi:hypothetical protein